MDNPIIQLILPILISIIASSGFWIWLGNKTQKKSLETQLLIGMAHDRIVNLCLTYITRTWITQDEYENLNVYLYQPYVNLGGNGSVKRLMLEVDKLPIRKDKFLDKITGDTLP